MTFQQFKQSWWPWLLCLVIAILAGIRRHWDSVAWAILAGVAELRKKINNYAAYARQGQLATDFPDLAGKPVFFQLWCIQHRPNSNLMEFLDRANAQLAQHSLQIRVLVIEVATPEMIREERRREGKPWWKIW